MAVHNNIVFHADDFGVSNTISQQIVDCINNGVVSSVSMICNTEGFGYAQELFYSNKKQFRIRLHINLVEGKPVAASSEVSVLQNKNGEFRHTFVSLWANYAFSSSKKKKQLKSGVETEIRAQLKMFRDVAGRANVIGVDSHTHIHMIPFVFNILINISKTENIGFIRMPNEPFFLDKKNIWNYFSLNLIKHLLLNFLSGIQKKKIVKSGIVCNDYFIGVLPTGKMSLSSFFAAVKQIKNPDALIEVLFHPGGVENESDVYWTTKKTYKKYYSSPNRTAEAEQLKSSFLKFNKE
jgi:chitin disaccharide deacetylase